MKVENVYFQTIESLPCWKIETGFIPFLSIEFGKPHLWMRHPIVASNTDFARVLKIKQGQPCVSFHGEYHLFINKSIWQILKDNRVIYDSAFIDENKYKKPLMYIEGKCLLRVDVFSEKQESYINFSNGYQIKTKSNGSGEDQWLLYSFRGKVVIFNNNGEIIETEYKSQFEEEDKIIFNAIINGEINIKRKEKKHFWDIF